jgi:endonuclease/exonuclease/phosphatase family metal-dependent hydrolase
VRASTVDAKGRFVPLRTIDARGGSWVATVVTTFCVVLLAQLVRAYVPLAFELGEEIDGSRGYMTAGAVAAVAFASPALAAVGGLAGRGRTALVAAVVMLGGARLGIQLVHPIPVWLGTLAVAVGLLAVPVVVGAVRRVAQDGALLVGVLLGLALDTAIRAGALTWDLVWQDGIVPVGVALATVALAVAAAVSVPLRGWSSSTPPSLRLAAFGPFLALQLLFLQNPASLASQSDLSLPVAAGAVLLIDAVALAAAGLQPRFGPLVAVVLSAMAAVGGYLLVDASGAAAMLTFGAEQVLLVLLLGKALIPEPSRRLRPGPLAASCALGSLAFVVVVFAYQAAFEVALPLPNAYVAPAAAAIVGFAAVPRRGTIAAIPARVAVVPLALLAVPALVGIGAPERSTAPAESPDVRVVVYNVHGGVTVDGQVDPQATADAIEAQDPDVVVLNEVGRGWPIFGTLDAAEWLARRLEMPYLFEPAADLRFGDAVLSRLPVVASSGGRLPFGAGPQQRSYLSVTFDVGDGRELVVIGTHLQESGSDPETRTRQIEFLLDAWGGATPAVVAGDMNMQPGEDDVQLFLDAGLVSVQDEIGDPCEPTAFEPKPEKPCDRPDWIFATPDLRLSGFEITRTSASDHLPITVAVTVPR